MIFLLLIGWPNFISCCNISPNIKKESKHEQITAVRLYSNFPVSVYEGRVLTLIDSADLIFFKDMVVYKNYDPYEIREMGFDAADNPILIRAKDSITVNYIVSKKNNSYGYFYNLSDSTKNRKVLMDTIRSKNSVFFSFSKIYEVGTNAANNIFVGSVQLENNDLMEKYVSKIKVDATYDDTTYFYYSTDPDLMAADFSFSKTADSIKNKKLYKLRTIYLANPSALDEAGKVEKEVIIGMKSIKVEDEKTIKELFEKTTKLYPEK